MHHLKSLLVLSPLLVSVLAVAAAAPDSDNLHVATREPEASSSLEEEESTMSLNLARDLGLADLTKRACDDKSGCKCRKNYEGVWCAQCVRGGKYVVTKLGKNDDNLDHVYQCNKNGNCCDYGYATKCKNGKAGRCGD